MRLSLQIRKHNVPKQTLYSSCPHMLVNTSVQYARTVWAHPPSGSHHDVVVLQLEAIEDPGGGGEEGGYSQREGQALQITATHYPHLDTQKRRGRRVTINQWDTPPILKGPIL